MNKKQKEHYADIDFVLTKIKKNNEIKGLYSRKNLVEDLQAQGVNIKHQTTIDMKSKGLPYAVTVLVKMAELANVTVDEIIKEL